MEHPRYTKEEVAERAVALYDQKIRSQVEPDNIGRFIVIDIETGEYEIGEDDVAVMKRAAAKHRPDALYGMRVGQPVMGRIGGRWTEAKT